MTLLPKMAAALLLTTAFSALAQSHKEPQEGSLSAGRVELRAFGGTNYSPSRNPYLSPRTPPTYGGELAVAITDALAGIGTFAYNRGGGDPTLPGTGSSIKEWMGGARLSLPIRDTPVTLYGSLSLGKVSFKEYIEGPKNALGVSSPTAVSAAHAGLAPAIGADIHLSRSVGIGVEFRAVKATDAGLYYRLCGSAYFRFP